MSELEFTAERIRTLLNEVAASLATNTPRPTIVVVGGSLLAWHGLRVATKDIDSIRRLDDELKRAVAEIAERHALAPNWINDNAAPFAPATFNEASCSVLIDHVNLLVLGASSNDVFLMKLFSSRVTDYADLVSLWSGCTFQSPAEAVERHYLAYPHEEHDPFLLDHITQIEQNSNI